MVDIIKQNDFLCRIVSGMFSSRDDILSLGVGHDEVDAVGRILRVAWDISRSRFAHTKHAYDNTRLAWKQKYDTITSFYTSAHQGMSHTVCFGIELCKGECTVFGNKCRPVSIFNSILFDRLIVQFPGNFLFACASESFHALTLIVVKHRKLCYCIYGHRTDRGSTES